MHPGGKSMHRATTIAGVVGWLLSSIVFLPAGHAGLPLGLIAVLAVPATFSGRSSWGWSVPTLYLVAAALLWFRHTRGRLEFALGASLSTAGAVIVAAFLWGTPVGRVSIDDLVWVTAAPSGLALVVFIALAILQKYEEHRSRGG